MEPSSLSHRHFPGEYFRVFFNWFVSGNSRKGEYIYARMETASHCWILRGLHHFFNICFGEYQSAQKRKFSIFRIVHFGKCDPWNCRYLWGYGPVKINLIGYATQRTIKVVAHFYW